MVSPIPAFKLAVDTTFVNVTPSTTIFSSFESVLSEGSCTRKPESVPARVALSLVPKYTSKGPASDMFPSMLFLAPLTK